jgi:hypothetical protein
MSVHMVERFQMRRDRSIPLTTSTLITASDDYRERVTQNGTKLHTNENAKYINIKHTHKNLCFTPHTAPEV